jgi:8-oxo-dGTP diphosphatase
MKSGVPAGVSRERAAECVSGVLISDGAVLVEKRRAGGDADPRLIWLPGGHVEVGESLNQALKREIQEEIGIQVRRITPIRVIYYTASNGEAANTLSPRQGVEGKITSNEAEAVYWESDISETGESLS